MMSTLNAAALAGKQNTVSQHIALPMIERLAATLGVAAPQNGDALPPLWHWMFFQEASPPENLGSDGHPSRETFVPPVSGYNRMWAGGRLNYLAPLIVGESAVRQSEIVAVKEKEGNSGKLIILTLRHKVLQHDVVAIVEEQDLVYREPAPPVLRVENRMPEPDWVQPINTTQALLFRYSAVTFNAHRIHYDWPYATQQEGYPGLVVQGPLIATLLAQAFADRYSAAKLTSFSFRSVRPLICGEPFDISGRVESPGNAALWAANDNGPAQKATVTFHGAV